MSQLKIWQCSFYFTGAWGSVVFKALRGSIPGSVTWDSFLWFLPTKPCALSLWKWVPGISPGVKAAGGFGWRPTTLVVPKVEKIRGLYLPGTPRVTPACRGIPLLVFTLVSTSQKTPLRKVTNHSNLYFVTYKYPTTLQNSSNKRSDMFLRHTFPAQYTGWEQSVQPFTESNDTRCCLNTICPPEDGHVNARNNSRIVV